MVDERFRSEEFARVGLDTDAARDLSALLENEVCNEMQTVLKSSFRSIVSRLNSMGHDLKLYDEALGEIAFRDDYESDSGYHCKLRVACDLIISSGYAHLIPNIDTDETTEMFDGTTNENR